MTARQYNFTKQNDVVMKARRRFTKQNGVVKQILNGWTKTNGVVEKVYESVIAPAFASIVEMPTDTGQLLYVDANNLVAVYTNHNNNVRVHNDYLSDGVATQISFGAPGGFGFNYAGGVLANQSLVSIGSTRYQEMPIADVYNPIQYYNYNVGSGGYFPIKLGTGHYVGFRSIYNYSRGVYEWYLYEYFPTGSTQVQYFGDYSSLFKTKYTPLTLYDGRGVFCAVNSTSNGEAVVLYDYDDTDPDKITSIVLADETNQTMFGSHIYTPNGQDCILSVVRGSTSTYFKLCKYNIQNKAVVMSSNLGSTGRRLIGTYNGYIYVLQKSYAQNELFVVEKYDLSFNLIDTHTIALLSGQALVSNIYNSTIHSGGRFVAVTYIDTNAVTQLLVLDLSLF